MTKAPKPLVAGNWKMNGSVASADEAKRMVEGLAALGAVHCEVAICPPFPLVGFLARVLAQGPIMVGAQDCHPKASGAHTGDVSAEMLADVGAKAVIVGHSERRQDHGESDALVAEKAQAAWRAGLTAIICVGETEAEREAGQTLDVVGAQIAGSVPGDATAANTVVAYEPVWAIGTGRTPTANDVAQVHAFLRETLVSKLGDEGKGVRLLYGGSVKPSNAVELMAVANVDGALVGGASLKADDFLGIIAAYKK
ncbi:triose-phosphate isomerase [Iodidimonas sp. SYSU 1G8]|uniref:triose-phosphate isomerase n=1 Tax=Iodidimonas sp. SYSU 1G8 TaxID=3133967 RepID=UPI0031FEF892